MIKLLNLMIYLNSILLALSAQSAQAKEVLLSPQNFQAKWRTIAPGDKVTLSNGIYREKLLLLANKSWTKHNPTSFVAKEPGKVIVKGSDVAKGWVSKGLNTYEKKWPIEPQQVFVDGKPLKQLAGTIFGGFPNDPKSTYHKLHQANNGGGIWPGRTQYLAGSVMPTDSFYYDHKRKVLTVSMVSDPSNKLMEVSVRRRPFYAEGVSGIVVDGLAFEHANTSLLGRGAAVTIIGNDNVIRNVTVKNVDLIGIQTVGDHNQIINSEVTYSGQMGVAMRGRNNTITGVKSNFNNTRGFNKWWEAGGYKFVGNGGLQDSIFRGNTAIGNHGDGIWFDWKNNKNIIEDNTSAFNAGFGIHYELSDGATIRDNFVYGNGQRGIYLRGSNDCAITNNLIVDNKLGGIVSVYTAQKNGSGGIFGGGNTIATNNIIGWNPDNALTMPHGAKNMGHSNHNLFLTNSKLINLNLGFSGRRTSSFLTWQNKTAYDLNSKHVIGKQPVNIKQSLKDKQLIKLQTWKALLNVININNRKDNQRISDEEPIMPNNNFGPKSLH